MVKRALRMIVQGTVQGIFFRQYIKNYADKMELKGFVRNLEDGNVEIVAEGENDDLEALLIEVKEGPKHSQIRNVEVEEKKWSGEFKEFKILRF